MRRGLPIVGFLALARVDLKTFLHRAFHALRRDAVIFVMLLLAGAAIFGNIEQALDRVGDVVAEQHALTVHVAGGATGRAGGAAPAEAHGTITSEERERTQRIWWYLLFAGLVLLGLEPLVANREPADLLGDEQAVADGQQQRQQPLVVADGPAELADRHRLGVALRRVGHAVVPQGVVEGHDAAGLEQP